MNVYDNVDSARERISLANQVDVPRMLFCGLVMLAVVAYALGAC